MQGCFVFLNFREAAYGFVEAVVCGVVIALTHLTHHHLAFTRFAVEAMIEVLLHADALAGMQDDTSAWLHCMLDTIDAIVDRCLGKLFVLVGIIELYDQITTTTIDDIFHLGPVEMHGCFLILLDYHNLLGIGFLIYAILAVADGKEEETAMQEIARTEVGDVPPQHTFHNIIYFLTVSLPVCKAPSCPFGQHKLT